MTITAAFICFFMALAFLGVLAHVANHLKEINEKMINYSGWQQLLRHFSGMQKEKP